jgi:hypothetical protein
VTLSLIIAWFFIVGPSIFIGWWLGSSRGEGIGFNKAKAIYDKQKERSEAAGKAFMGPRYSDFMPDRLLIEYANSLDKARIFPLYGQDIEIAVPKEKWMPLVGQIPIAQLEKMLESAVEQELYETAAFVKKELDLRKTTNP